VARANNPEPETTTTTETGAGATTTVPTTTTTPEGPGGPGGLGTVIKDSSPGGATSFPLPLIILGGLAIFLLAAGAVGLIVRRQQGSDPGTA
jgi:hypothetical protein